MPFHFFYECFIDASEYVMGQCREKILHFIHYDNKTSTCVQINYVTTKKEMIDVFFVFEKFRSYLIGSKVIVYIDHATMKYLFGKKDAKPTTDSMGIIATRVWY